MTPPKVVVFGTSGYAGVHLRRARAMHDTAEIRFVGACDVREPAPDARTVLPDDAVLTDNAQDLFDRTAPDIAVVATPPHTHLPVALTAIAAGCHVLLEKPPVQDLDSFQQLATKAQRAGVRCQVGFQSFGSAALHALRAAIATSAIGRLTGVGTAGAWVRRDAYYTRNPWAGRRTLDGKSVVDGSLTNPFAHAIATAILVAGKAEVLPATIETELYHVRPIEADDTACARIVFANGIKIVAAATLCAEQQVDPYVVLHGTRGKARWWYRSDVLEVNGERVPVGQPIDLLRNLARHVRDKTPLVAPLSQTRAFTAFVQAVRDHPGPQPIPPGWVDTMDEGPQRRHTVHGIDKFVESAAETMSLFSELGVPWAI
ncbi:putative dehydrogenase [Kibdelosporangium banguiense]|uniref:Dehydrogenase n=1 Tax=Kibdelosporangium banguiense TaxID=1365924 RepID=A0ABS4TU20_9PSEU|nr:Gfo/Idh/MocA family oxidoreductase [Kibdelosporangium banguiense]MBP2327446.1 putative dehydrogenase [Kibdelosporangium banguiense]